MHLFAFIFVVPTLASHPETRINETGQSSIRQQRDRFLQARDRSRSEPEIAEETGVANSSKAVSMANCSTSPWKDVQVRWEGGKFKPLCMTAKWVDMLQSGGGFVTMVKCDDANASAGSAAAQQRWSTHSVNHTIQVSSLADDGFNTAEFPIPYSLQINQRSSYYQQQGQIYLDDGSYDFDKPTFEILRAGYSDWPRWQILVKSFGFSGCLHIATGATDPRFPKKPADDKYEEHGVFVANCMPNDVNQLF